MAHEPSQGKTVCLYGFKHYVTLHVTPTVTVEEAQNINIRRSGPLPRVHLVILGPTDETKVGTSFVCVDGIMYCIACPPERNVLSNVVKTFDPCAAELILDHSCPKMKQDRSSPFSTVMGGIVYVFGGVNKYKLLDTDHIWAECLDTNQPKDMQEWAALPAPPLHGLLQPSYALPFRDNNILLFGSGIGRNCLLFNVNNKSWTEYNILPEDDSFGTYFGIPVIVESHNTIYWIFGFRLYALDLESKKFSSGDILNSVLYDIRSCGPEDTAFGRVLMHLEGDVFCVFTTYEARVEESQSCQILECTKFRVTKSLPSVLQIDVLGYQSYISGGLLQLYGGVPIIPLRDP